MVNNKWNWICIVLSLIVIAPMLIYASKSLPAVDDFAAAALISSADSEWSRIVLVFNTVYQSYFSRGGIWFSSIINGVFEPYSYAGIQGIRFFNVAANIFFFGSLFAFIHIFVKKFLNVQKAVVWPLYCLVVIIIVNGYQNHDVWTWCTGVATYLVPVSIMFCVVACFILSMHRTDKLYLIIAVGAFCVGGASLNIAALNCGILLLFGLYAYLYLGKRKESLVVFCSAFCGAIFNTVAPGNYVRQSTMTGDLSVAVALKNSLLLSLKLFGDRISFSPFLAVFILIFLGAAFFIDFRALKMDLTHPWIAAAIVLLGLVVVNFPVCLGYANRTPHPRCVFVNDIALYVLSLFWVIYYAGYKKTTDSAFKINWKFSRYLVGVLFIVTAVLMGTHGGMERFTTGYMVKSIVDGSFEEYVRHEEGIFAEIESSVDSKVVVIREKEKTNLIMKSVGITTNPKDIGNEFVARFFGKESVRIKYIY